MSLSHAVQRRRMPEVKSASVDFIVEKGTLDASLAGEQVQDLLLECHRCASCLSACTGGIVAQGMHARSLPRRRGCKGCQL